MRVEKKARAGKTVPVEEPRHKEKLRKAIDLMDHLKQCAAGFKGSRNGRHTARKSGAFPEIRRQESRGGVKDNR